MRRALLNMSLCVGWTRRPTGTPAKLWLRGYQYTARDSALVHLQVISINFFFKVFKYEQNIQLLD